MSQADPSVGAVAVHQKVPDELRNSASLHEDTAQAIWETRDRVNEELGAKVLSVNDVVRLCLLATARYDGLASGDIPEPTAVDEERYRPLTAVVRDELAGHEDVPDRDDTTGQTEGE